MATTIFKVTRGSATTSATVARVVWMLWDVLNFNRQGVEDHAADRLADFTLGEYFRHRKFSPRFLTDYLAPMGTVIWSAPASETLDFPAENFVAFFSNHRLLQYDRPIWRTAKGAASARWRTDRGISRPASTGLRRGVDRTYLARRDPQCRRRATATAGFVVARTSLARCCASCCRRLSTRSGRRPP